jgi:hypothetical protein
MPSRNLVFNRPHSIYLKGAKAETHFTRGQTEPESSFAPEQISYLRETGLARYEGEGVRKDVKEIAPGVADGRTIDGAGDSIEDILKRSRMVDAVADKPAPDAVSGDKTSIEDALKAGDKPKSEAKPAKPKPAAKPAAVTPSETPTAKPTTARRPTPDKETTPRPQPPVRRSDPKSLPTTEIVPGIRDDSPPQNQAALGGVVTDKTPI